MQTEDQQRLDEGLPMLMLDYALAIRIIKYLWQGFDQTPAFRAGIIDADGNKIRDPVTIEEKSAYSPFVRLVLRLKKLLGAVPGGKSKIGSMIAAYALMREAVADEKQALMLDEVLAPVFAGKMTLEESFKFKIPGWNPETRSVSKKDLVIDTWYDRSLRLWCTHLNDKEGNQVTDTKYDVKKPKYTINDFAHHEFTCDLTEDGAVAAAPVNSTAGATSPTTGGYDKPLVPPKKKNLDTVVNRRKPITVLQPTVEKKTI